MRRNLIYRTAIAGMASHVMSAAAICIGIMIMGSAAVDAQTTSSAPSTSSPASQQWSSRILDSADLTTSTIPSMVPPTTVKIARKRTAAAKSTSTSTSAAPNGGAATSVAPRSDGSSATNAIPPEVWLALRECESHNRYDLNTGNGYYGAYQFKLGTWQNLGFTGFPHAATPAVQDEAARALQAKAGWGQWGECSRRIGMR